MTTIRFSFHKINKKELNLLVKDGVYLHINWKSELKRVESCKNIKILI